MDQPKKPAPTRDIADLKARLGLAKPGAAPMAPPGAAPFRPGAPTPPPGQMPGQFGGPMPGAAPGPGPSPGRSSTGFPAAPAPQGPPPGLDPFAGMRPPAGQQFDLRTVDDGSPVANMQSRGGKSGLVIGAILLVVGMGLGFGFGANNIARRFNNQANAAAKSVKSEIEGMQKTLGAIGTAVAASQQRLQAAKQDALSYDPKLIADLEAVKLDPRPDTARIFKVNYFLMPDIAVDQLMNYYYDSIALYNEVERHVKRTKADEASLTAYAAKGGGQKGNYGVVFDNAGKLIVANLVEVGKPVCKGGGEDCPADQVTGFQIRSGAGANWVGRNSGAKLDPSVVVPLRPTPLMDAVMAGSPEQVRMEAYRQRTNNIRLLVARITGTQKELSDQIDKAASRPDLFTL